MIISGFRRILSTTALTAAAVALSGCVGFGGDNAYSGYADPRHRAMLERYTAEHQAVPGDANAVIGLAKALRYTGDTKAAVRLLEDNRDTHGGRAEFLTELGAAYLAAGDRKAATAVLLTSADIDPGYWRTHGSLGVAYALDDRHDQAQLAYEKALASCPDSATIHNNVGLSAANSGDINAALSWLGAALELQPDSRQIQANYALFQDVRANCVNCDESDIKRLTAGLKPRDWTGAGGELACGPTATQIADTLAAQAFVDVRVQFAFDSDVLLNSAKDTLNDVAFALMSPDFAGQRFLIEGHADAVGTDRYNQDLSERRAASVRRYLVGSGGVEASRLESVGFGEKRLLDPNNPTSGINRRVRVSIIAE